MINSVRYSFFAIFLLFLAVFIAHRTYSQTLAIENSVKYLDTKTATVVGAGGLIMKTKDGGANWFVETSPTTNELRSLDFADAYHSVIVGELGTILVANSFGSGWEIRNSGISCDLNSVQGLSPSEWVACGNDGTIIKSYDEGQSWSRKNSGTSAALKDAKFVDSFNGLIIGANGTLLRTNNSGENWVSVNMGIGNQLLNAIDMLNINQGIVVGNNGLIMLTFDGGTTWFAPLTTPQSDNIYDVKYLSDSIAIAAGANGLILKSSNAGLTWTRIELSFISSNIDLKCVNFANALMGISVGEEGTKIYTIDGGNTWSDSPLRLGNSVLESVSGTMMNKVQLIQNYPNPFNPMTTITYSLPFDSKVTIKIYDIAGKEVSELANGFQNSGNHSLVLDASNLASGVYFYRLTVNNGSHDICKSMKMLLNK
jgi:photosystem II stability/assembly factor-like uncharacterized protein